MRKILYILIGPKGSGKTYIGSKVNKNTDIKFLRVEPIWLKLAPGENGWEAVEKEIDKEFQQHSKVMIESLGAGDGFNQMHSSLRNQYEVKLIKVYADLEECLKSLRNRDNSEHIPVSDEKVEEYNKIAASINHQWDAVIDNNSPATDEDILRVIESI
ncbi:shikimate kinase [Coleofasciculus sp. FACHB-SPT36]|uniref:shikimate kinase n=1 Tax=Cyanophyceae TaxID=3028117 RepID=UPI00168C0346|nr:shikimate kinase [Coleofasciculus sp. FACHB-SPT36]MBD2539627.1 shikimate kinase [Coleofasciculus sp. FACHB-SPT36]